MPDPQWQWFNTGNMRTTGATDAEMKVLRARFGPGELLLDTDRILLYTVRGGILCAWVRRDVIDEEKEAE